MDVRERSRERLAERVARARGGGRSAGARPRPPPGLRRASPHPAGQRSGRRRRQRASAARRASSAPARRSAARRGTSGAGRRGAQPVEVGAGLAAELDDVGEALGGDQRGARAAPSSSAFVATVIPCDERARRPPRSTPARSSAAATAAITPSDWSSRRRRRLRRDEPVPEREDGVGERPADVDAEQHAGKLPASARSVRRDAPVTSGPLQPRPHRNKAPRKRGPITELVRPRAAAVTSSSVSARCWCDGQ